MFFGSMPMLLNSALQEGLAATLFALAGIGLALRLTEKFRHRIETLIFLALGVLLAVTVCEILPEAKGVLSWTAFIFATLSGWALFWVISIRTKLVCPSCSQSGHLDESLLTLRRLRLFLMALCLHSALDGMALTSADALGAHRHWGLIMAVALHKIPEGLAWGFLLLGAGFNRRRIWLWSIIGEGFTFWGALLTYLGVSFLNATGLALVLAHLGGGFLFLAASTMITSQKNAAALSKLLPLTCMAFALTLALLWIIR